MNSQRQLPNRVARHRFKHARLLVVEYRIGVQTVANEVRSVLLRYLHLEIARRHRISYAVRYDI